MSLEHLTKKNQQYVRTAQKLLEQAGKSPEEIETLLATILPDIEEKQEKGFTARALYGTPTQWVRSQLDDSQADKADERPTNSNPWLMWLESSLFLLAFLGILGGLINQFLPSGESYGALTLFSVSFGGGAVFYSIYHFIYRYYEPEFEGSRPQIKWAILSIAAVILLWIAFIAVTQSFIAAFNAPLAPWILIAIGLLAFGIRYWLMKTYNIKNTRINPRRRVV